MMKNLFKNIVLFAVLSVAFSNFTACTNTETSKNGAVIEIAPDNKNATEAKDTNYPPAPAEIMQAQIQDVDGNTFKLEDKKGKVVLVNLWAIWCGPCIAEMPEFVKLQDQYKDKNFEVIGLNTGDRDGQQESAENIKEFAQKNNITYHLAYADDALVGEFVRKSKMNGIPQTFLINREGKLTNIFTGGGAKMVNTIKETVEKVLNE